MHTTVAVALIGCGHIAHTQYGPALRALASERRDLRLAACCDLDAERAAAFAAQFGFGRSYADAEEMLRAEAPDGVLLLVPPSATAAAARRLLELGCRRLLVEKPPGLRLEEAAELSLAAGRRGANVMAAFNRRHMPVVRLLQARLGELAPEDIHCIRYEMVRHRRTDPDFSLTAIHGLDAARFVAGSDYAGLRFRYRELADVAAGAANIAASGEFANGTEAELRFYPMAGCSRERITVFARDAVMDAELPFTSSFGGNGRLTVYRNGTVAECIDIDPRPGGGNGFYEAISEFLAGIRHGTAPADDVASAFQAVETAACIRARRPAYAADRPGGGEREGAE